jgi:hypothetical protein
MSKFKIALFLLAGVLTFTSCEKKDNDPVIESSFDWVDGNVFTNNVTIDSSNVSTIEIKNTTNKSVTLMVEVLENTIPTMWMGMVCITGTCFGELPVAGTELEMWAFTAQDDYGYVRLTVNPMVAGQGGTIKLKIYDVANPSDSKTCSWTVTSIN